MKADHLHETIHVPSHYVSAATTPLYPKADLKSGPVIFLPMNAKLNVSGEDGAYVKLITGGFVFAKHVASLNMPQHDIVAVAELFINTPYLWGGNTRDGIDCSGLIQMALKACGRKCLRDSDMQQAQLGQTLRINDLDGLIRGDLVFWDGHVGIMYDQTQLLHANGYHMQTVIEPLRVAATRIAETHKPITSLKRL